jgi:enoyl-CoA hydratase/carnithine racemase
MKGRVMARKPARKAAAKRTGKKAAAKKAVAKKAVRKSTQRAKAKSSRYKNLFVAKRKGVLEIQLHRPDVLNAMNPEMATELRKALAAIELDRKIFAVILLGDERSFCAGADLGTMGKGVEQRFDSYRARFNVLPNRRLYTFLQNFTKPVISAVEGYCLGGGLELAMWGDFIVAGEDAQFALPEVRHSLIPGGGGTLNLPKLIGPALAKELIWTARRIKAAEAKELGIVNHVMPKGKALAKAREITAEMAKNGPLGLMMSKIAINRGLDLPRHLAFFQEADLAHLLSFSEDRDAGLKAFAERRRAEFKGQ